MSKFLPYSNEDERKALILIEETKEQLNVDPNTLGRHSSIEVLFKCIVCGLQNKLSKKRIMDGKGLSHLGECRTILKKDGGARAVQNTSAEKRQNRLEQARKATTENKEEIVAKRKKTNLEKYGTEIAQRDEQVRAKMSSGIKEAYKDGSVVEKRRETNIERYGSSNYLASKEGSTLFKKINNEKLGVDYPFQSPEIRAQFPSILKAKYGVENYRQLPEQRNKLKEWCQANPEKMFTSKAEQEIKDWVRTFYPSAEKYREEQYEIDIYVPEINLGIEYNGLFWHSESTKHRNYHLNKTNFFAKRGIRIIHIWEHEWKDRKEQVKSFLQSAIGKNSTKLNVRDCRIVWSAEKKEKVEASKLLDAYHIQGSVSSTKYVANVYYKDELISTAVFGLHHRNSVDWVLTRFCTKQDYTVRGLLGKISKIAHSEFKQRVVSWADYRFSLGNGYEKAGWILEDKLPPDYFYFKLSTGIIHSKQSRQKKLVGTPENMTELEHAHQDGLERVWDCGKMRFSFNPT